ncbi:MAG: excinuclease ABC subunit UvrC [Candidatus Brocadiaceae bacterium]|nr:excinuclease ABC subunit UvrC [Candidatus Brocadiaceae bacterium]
MAASPSELVARKLGDLPRRSGVYLFKNARQEVIYVGKAKDLRARVRSYWQGGRDEGRLICRRIDQVADIAVVVTESEKEALLLEGNFIKQFRPACNVEFRDDKSFVSIRLDPGEPWPRPVVTRRLDMPEALYFGPYANARAARQTVRVLQEVFPLRRCTLRECRERRRPCLYGEMGRCLAPCCAEVSAEEYGRMVDQVVLFLRGRGEELLGDLREQMAAAAGRQEFERAAVLRDRIGAIRTTLEAQHVSSSATDVDRDVFGLCTVDGQVHVAVLFVRGGNVRDAATYRFPAELDSEQAIFGSFLNQFYARNRFIPAEVLVPVPTEDAALLESWLCRKRGRRVRILRPQRGPKRRLVELANGNARQAEREASTRRERAGAEVQALQDFLGLRRPPVRIECFDISTLQGREAVGAMVVFEAGVPERSSYRRYRIRGVRGQDDFAMMREVLTRRYRRCAARDGAAERLPDLVLVDGGRGHLSVATDVLEGLGLAGCEVAALAKARARGGRRLAEERIFLPGRADPIVVPERSPVLRLVTRVRDEAHRFAVSYHRALRRRATTESPLLGIPGVGPKTARRLLDALGGLEAVREAGLDELRGVRGVSERVARAVHDHYHRPAGPSGV